MTDDHAAFMKAIIERPDDDLPRLVFADYLDERGEPERAEFIRVQCALARCACSQGAVGLCDGCLPLRRREEELYATSDAWMLPHLSDVFAGVVIDIRELHFAGEVDGEAVGLLHRGFVEEVACSSQDWRRHAEDIRAATPLRTVRLTTWPPWSVTLVGDVRESLALIYPGITFEFPDSHTAGRTDQMRWDVDAG